MGKNKLKITNQNKVNCNKGITLISLVVTIIILMILAGVSIAMLTGENGIVTKAKEAKQQTEIAQDEEKLSILYYDLLGEDDKDVKTGDYLNYLEEKGIPTKEENGNYYAEENGRIYQVTVEDNGDITIDYDKDGEIKEPRIINIEAISKSSTSIKIKATALRMNNGTYTYYISTDENNFGKASGNNTTGEYEFTNLNGKQGTYYIKVEAENEGGKASKTITETIIVDTTSPEIKLEVAEVTTKSIKVKATATDKESGISGMKYTFYIADSLGQIASATPAGTSSTGEYVFDDLNQNTTYYLKATIKDRAGNNAETTTTGETKLIPAAETAIKRDVKWGADKTATVALSTDENFKIQYSEDETNWQDYSNAVSLNSDKKMYIVLTDGKNYGENFEINASDTKGPNVTISREDITTNTIKVSVNATDDESGMPDSPQYNYYIKTEEESDYTLVAENSKENAYTYTGLNAKTAYNIKVTTKDLFENEGEGIATYTTQKLKYENGNIAISDATWENKLAKVTITNNTDYDMQYKVIPEGEEIVVAEGMINTKQKTVDVTNLKNNYTVIARLYDGTNYSTDYATYQVKDVTAPTINVDGIPTEWQKENVVLTINAEDKESGLANLAYSFDGGKNWQTENTKEYTENTSGIVIKVRDIAGNIATYPTTNITNIDNKGPNIEAQTNTTSNTISVKITEITDSGVGVSETPNVTYKISKNEENLDSVTGETTTYSESNNTKTYTGLEQSTTYYIQIEVEDNLGNKTKKILTIATGSLNTSTDSLKISDIVWQDQKASSKISNESEYQMQYQVVKQGNTFDDTKNWSIAQSTEVNLSELYNEDTIYARLTDGVNYSANVIKVVKDSTLPTITNVTGNAENWTKNNVTLQITATDNESGLAQMPYSFDSGATWQAENTKEYTENTSGIVIQVKDKAGNIASYDTIDINKIDKIGPQIEIMQTANNTKQVTVSIKATDSASRNT